MRNHSSECVRWGTGHIDLWLFPKRAARMLLVVPLQAVFLTQVQKYFSTMNFKIAIFPPNFIFLLSLACHT